MTFSSSASWPAKSLIKSHSYTLSTMASCPSLFGPEPVLFLEVMPPFLDSSTPSFTNLDHVNSILNSDTNCFASFKNSSGITLANLLSSSQSNSGSNGASNGGQNHQESNNGSNNFGEIGSSRNIAWSNGTDSHDSGIGHSPPFDSNNMGN